MGKDRAVLEGFRTQPASFRAAWAASSGRTIGAKYLIFVPKTVERPTRLGFSKKLLSRMTTLGPYSVGARYETGYGDLPPRDDAFSSGVSTPARHAGA
ncbi:MAG TPA: hypothetical protein VGC27_07580, partial [Rhizomicrobium sp.]